MGFNKNFKWGAATSSYQIEGAAYEDGKGLSVWDMMCKRPNAIKNNDTGDVACDHYHRYKEDVALMKELGLKAYRFSISWPRVLADGIGKVNEKGLEFYDKLVDELLKNGITPYVTLFHWDYPYELLKKGGWLNADSSDWFAEYTRVIVEKLSDRVENWITFNEPQVFLIAGHQGGKHAPGLKLSMYELLQASHNVFLAHGKSVQTIRKYCKKPARIGYAPVGRPRIPATNSLKDIEAARKSTFSAMESDFFRFNAWWMDPVYLGEYPKDGLENYRQYIPNIKQDDMKTICQPLDFFGVNIYKGEEVYMNENGQICYTPSKVGDLRTANDWGVTPEALYWGPKFFYERYKKSIVITENGMSNIDWISLDGKVHDPQRIDFLHRYLREFRRAAEDGVDAEAYFCWSLMDNFEWPHGYNERFGLIHVDFKTQKRIIKDSGYWYKKVIESNGSML